MLCGELFKSHILLKTMRDKRKRFHKHKRTRRHSNPFVKGRRFSQSIADFVFWVAIGYFPFGFISYLILTPLFGSHDLLWTIFSIGWPLLFVFRTVRMKSARMTIYLTQFIKGFFS